MKRTKTQSAKPEEQAFRRSDGYHFLGQKLEPFSFVRQSALAALLSLMGTTAPTELAAAMWLMTQDDAKCREARANPANYVEAVEKFADEQGIMMAGRAWTPAVAIYETICADMRAAKGIPVTGAKSEGDAAYDPN